METPGEIDRPIPEQDCDVYRCLEDKAPLRSRDAAGDLLSRGVVIDFDTEVERAPCKVQTPTRKGDAVDVRLAELIDCLVGRQTLRDKLATDCNRGPGDTDCSRAVEVPAPMGGTTALELLGDLGSATGSVALPTGATIEVSAVATLGKIGSGDTVLQLLITG